MTNFEKYKNEILKLSTQGIEKIPVIVNGKPASCDNTRCEDCELGDDCTRDFFKWLYEDDGEEQGSCMGCKHEYKEKDGSPCTECSMNYTSKWERRPKKTRQDEFLEHYPNAEKYVSGVLTIAPCSLGERKHQHCENGTCWECKRNYWLQEVEE